MSEDIDGAYMAIGPGWTMCDCGYRTERYLGIDFGEPTSFLIVDNCINCGKMFAIDLYNYEKNLKDVTPKASKGKS